MDYGFGSSMLSHAGVLGIVMAMVESWQIVMHVVFFSLNNEVNGNGRGACFVALSSVRQSFRIVKIAEFGVVSSTS